MEFIKRNVSLIRKTVLFRHSDDIITTLKIANHTEHGLYVVLRLIKEELGEEVVVEDVEGEEEEAPSAPPEDGRGSHDSRVTPFGAPPAPEPVEPKAKPDLRELASKV